jgi:hypothetical protein
MDNVKIVIPDTKEKIKEQILALKIQIQDDTSKKDKEIHQQALAELKKALQEG